MKQRIVLTLHKQEAHLPMALKNFGRDLLHTLIRPRKGLARVADTRNIWQGIFLYVVISLLAVFSVAQSITVEALIGFLENWNIPFPVHLAQSFIDTLPVLSLIAQFIFGTLLFCIWLSIVNLFAELFSGEGDASRLGAVFGFAALPYLLLAPTALWAHIIPLQLLLLLGLVAFVWSQLLKIIGLKEAHNLTLLQALAAYLLPVATLLMALLLFVLMSVAFLLPFVVEFLDSITRSF